MCTQGPNENTSPFAVGVLLAILGLAIAAYFVWPLVEVSMTKPFGIDQPGAEGERINP